MMPGKLIAACMLALSVAGQARARPFCTDPPFIHFLPLVGTSGSRVLEILKDIDADDYACFKLRVPGARTLHVTVASTGKNSSLQIYPPGWVITRDGRAFSFGVDPLPGTAAADQAKSWTGPLPSTAVSTLIVIANKGRAGAYMLHLEVY